MKSRTPLRLAALAAILLSACAHKSLDTGSLPEVRRLAIVSRVAGNLEVSVARADSREGRAYPTLSPKEADAALAAELSRQVGIFEVEERIRSSLVQRLPASPPWSTSMPAVEVATTLDSLLVEDRSGPPDYRALARHGSNSVLEIVVEELGLRHEKGKSALFVKGRARMFLLDGRTLWKAPIDVDDALDPETEGLDVVELRNGGYRDALIDLVGRIADKLAADLTGGES